MLNVDGAGMSEAIFLLMKLFLQITIDIVKLLRIGMSPFLSLQKPSSASEEENTKCITTILTALWLH